MILEINCTNLTTYQACSIIEGFSYMPVTDELIAAAWSTLIRTGAAWQLQGYYGRQAESLIQSGIFDRKGNILINVPDYEQ